MKKHNVSIFILLLFCLFINPVMLKGSNIISYAYIYGIPLVYLLLHFGGVLRLSNKQFRVLSLSFFLFLLCLIYPVMHGSHDTSYILVATYVFRKLIVYLFLFSILARKYGDNLRTEHFMGYFACSQAVYVIVTIIFVLIPSIKDVWFSIFKEVVESEEVLKSFGYTFRIGWQGFSGFSHTIYCTIACVFALYLYYGTEIENRITSLQFWIIYLLSFAGNMFYGRSGLVVTIVSSIIAVFTWNRKSITKLAKYILIIAIGIALVMNLQKIPLFSDWFYWMSKPLENLLKTGSFNNASFSATSADIVFPGIKTFFLGDGYFTVDNRFYMRTDSGFMRNLYFWGIIGTGLAYGLTVSSISFIKKKNSILFIVMLFTFAVFEYKGIVYYEYLALFITLSFCENLRKKFRRLRLSYEKAYNDSIWYSSRSY